ncbi:(2,3-dihydroxybenzoyl)adenylate synthase [Vibrio sp. OCN044]|uniref:(2,3-dihydroxybenzoyl)adenylate synthase n=1 Tax=Vibrio tetraodonis subsp. pristinus TaxID=2695891 RepID=A0A6L8LU34_9VIBR|nr:(2,3-dihydroxybenzoyl)adenylate synthase [Vibrio tetraodonis]MYM58150.1 (2,3-dihydroxybenzoyl)adenylate synthase [Vibrio tetraodonis subsp. pristinus]
MSNIDFTPWPENMSQRYKQLGYWQDKTLFDHLNKVAVDTPDAEAVRCGDNTYSYRNLIDRIYQLSAGFCKLGLNSGDNVILQMDNRVEFYLCFFALTLKGIKPVLALPAHRYLEVSYFCTHVNARAYIFSDNVTGKTAQATATKLLKECTNLDFAITTDQATHNEITSLVDLFIEPCSKQEASADNVAFFQLSGGTTGTPKLIPRTHNDYAYSILGSNKICQFDAQTRYLCTLPAAHNFPLSSPGSLGTFFSGGLVILSSNGSPEHNFSLIEKHKVTTCALVPPLALLWMQHAEESTKDISSLNLIQVGGAKFSENAANKISDILDCRLQQVFGMAEGLVNYTRLDDPIDVITKTQGRPISEHDEIMIVNDEGIPVPIGEEGHLMTRGPYTIRGYYRAPEHNQRSFNQDGFYATGDLVRQTREGNIIVTGRDKDQINRGGEKIAAEEVENLILKHQGVHDVALIAVSDEFLGEKSCAIIVANPNETLKPVTIKKFLHAQGIADYKIPDHIKFCQQLPKTPVGKINKKALRDLYGS